MARVKRGTTVRQNTIKFWNAPRVILAATAAHIVPRAKNLKRRVSMHIATVAPKNVIFGLCGLFVSMRRCAHLVSHTANS